MNGEDYAEKLKRFKENERPEAVLRIADDPELTNIVIAWANTTVKTRKAPTRLRSDSEADIWEWLWSNAEYSRLDLIARAGVSEYTFDKRFAVLVGNRILYPDGTLNCFVERYLREKVVKLFDSTAKKSRKAASQSS
jgi:hypothetical protein